MTPASWVPPPILFTADYADDADDKLCCRSQTGATVSRPPGNCSVPFVASCKKGLICCFGLLPFRFHPCHPRNPRLTPFRGWQAPIILYRGLRGWARMRTQPALDRSPFPLLPPVRRIGPLSDFSVSAFSLSAFQHLFYFSFSAHGFWPRKAVRTSREAGKSSTPPSRPEIPAARNTHSRTA